jgi:hypothetical protein
MKERDNLEDLVVESEKVYEFIKGQYTYIYTNS